MAKGGGHEAPKAHGGGGGGGGGHSMEAAAKFLAVADDKLEQGVNILAPTVAAGYYLLRGLDVVTGYTAGFLFAFGYSFSRGMLKGGGSH